jgi:AhpD family alkylhydroperoxidase
MKDAVMSHARSEYADFQKLAPDAFDIVMALGKVAAAAGLDKELLELVKLRASQINGCAFCVQFHILQAERLGVSVDKLNLVVVWREVPQFSARERAALAWTEALTLLANGVSDEVYAEAAQEFSEKELTYLTSAIASINVWNRFGAAYRWTPPVRQKKIEAAA